MKTTDSINRLVELYIQEIVYLHDISVSIVLIVDKNGFLLRTFELLNLTECYLIWTIFYILLQDKR